MFDLPNAKRIRRSELYARSRSVSPTPSEPDPEVEAQFRARLASIYGPSSNLADASIPDGQNKHTSLNDGGAALEPPAEQEFEFRLFSTSAPGKSDNENDKIAQKILLVDEQEDVGDGGFVVRERNRRYYFAEKASGEKQWGFEIMALSGEEVLSRAKKRAWGLEVPWRVRVLKVHGKNQNGEVGKKLVGVGEGEHSISRKRPGKKRRIILRERMKSREKLQEQRRAETEKKEEAEREKRTRRNREKKVKRKMKEKAKKAGGAAEDGVNDTVTPKEPVAGDVNS